MMVHDVYKDHEGESRIEVQTDGEHVRIGRDVEDPELHVSVPYQELSDLYDTIRHCDGATTFTAIDHRGIQKRYVVSGKTHTKRVFHQNNLVLVDYDRELGALRYAAGKVSELRNEKYDSEDVAYSYGQYVFPDTVDLCVTASSEATGTLEVCTDRSQQFHESSVQRLVDENGALQLARSYVDFDDETLVYVVRVSIDEIDTEVREVLND